MEQIHLGDYIYESGKGTLGKDPRATNPKGEIFTLYGKFYTQSCVTVF
jgi:hypothetical protein